MQYFDFEYLKHKKSPLKGFFDCGPDGNFFLI